jgi:hypothetical protein
VAAADVKCMRLLSSTQKDGVNVVLLLLLLLAAKTQGRAAVAFCTAAAVHVCVHCIIRTTLIITCIKYMREREVHADCQATTKIVTIQAHPWPCCEMHVASLICRPP